MQKEVTIVLSASQEFHLHVHRDMTPQEARQWLDHQFVELDCEPLRASGKVLIADKILAIASTASVAQFEDPQWGEQFAAAVLAAVGKPSVRVDIPNVSVNY